MSDQRPEIQRLTESFDEGGYLGIAADTDGELVLHSDHLRHLTLAKIEVLEEMNERLGGYSKSVEGYCASKIAALRKELENG